MFYSIRFQGKGHAEMAVSRYRTFQSGITTPESIPSTPMTSSFDEESVREILIIENKLEFCCFFSSGINVVHLIILPSVDRFHRLPVNNKFSRMSLHRKLNRLIFDKVD